MRCLCAIFLCLLLPVTASADSPFEGLTATAIDEPVFNRQVMVYHGGRDEGIPVVLVHGIGTEAATVWTDLVAALKDEHPVIAFDLPGFGQSSRGDGHFSPDNYATVLHRVISAFSEGPVIVVGHSLGGAISLRYAARYPERVHTLHLASVAGILHRSAYAAFLTRVGNGEGQVDGRGPPGNPVDRAVASAIRKLVRRTPDASILMHSAFFRQTVLGGDPETIAAMALVNQDFGPSLDQVRAPTHIYWGEQDPTAPLRTGQILAARLPLASLTVFADAGHVPMVQMPGRFNEVLMASLNSGQNAEVTQYRGMPAEPGEANAVCEDEAGFHLTGAFDRIVIDNCQEVVLTGIFARELVIRSSRVRMRDVVLASESNDTAALQVDSSELLVTGGRLSGPWLMDTRHSFIDMAGTVLETAGQAVRNTGASSEFTFSVVTLKQNGRQRYLHDVMAFEEGNTL